MPCILVVGDDPAPLNAIRTEPRLSDARIGTALGEADVLHTLRTCPADVVITDARTPVSSDLVLLDELRQVRPGVRMISIAPATTQDDVVSALRGGMFACFSAPADPGELGLMTWRAIQEEDWRHGIEVRVLGEKGRVEAKSKIAGRIGRDRTTVLRAEEHSGSRKPLRLEWAGEDAAGRPRS